MLPLLWLSAVLSYAAFRSGGGEGTDMCIAALAIGGLAAVHGMRRRRLGDLRLPRFVAWPLLAVPIYAAFQLVPLPVALVGLLSPERAKLIRAAASTLDAPTSWVSLNVAPGEGVTRFLLISTAILIFLVTADLAGRTANCPWRLAAPLVAIATAEAVTGMLQAHFGAGEARGTWENRNHFANFLALCAPFPAMYAFALMQRPRPRQGLSPAVLASIALSIATVLILGVMYSLSRLGLTAALAGLLVAVISATTYRWRALIQTWTGRLATGAAGFLVLLVCLLLLSPLQLVVRFGGDEITAPDRYQLWRESLRLVPLFPVFGTGLGGYESAFLQHKQTSVLVRDQFVHNDYLQHLIELGLAGTLLIAVPAAAIVIRTARAVARRDPDYRALAAACFGSFVVMLLHSTAEFNLYVPANLYACAWVAGIAWPAGHMPAAEVWGTVRYASLIPVRELRTS